MEGWKDLRIGNLWMGFGDQEGSRWRSWENEANRDGEESIMSIWKKLGKIEISYTKRNKRALSSFINTLKGEEDCYSFYIAHSRLILDLSRCFSRDSFDVFYFKNRRGKKDWRIKGVAIIISLFRGCSKKRKSRVKSRVYTSLGL